MRLRIRRAWEWWRRNCVPVSMFALVVTFGWASFQLNAISEQTRKSAGAISYVGGQLEDLERELDPDLGSGISDYLSYISSGVSGIESELAEKLGSPCSN